MMKHKLWYTSDVKIALGLRCQSKITATQNVAKVTIDLHWLAFLPAMKADDDVVGSPALSPSTLLPSFLVECGFRQSRHQMPDVTEQAVSASLCTEKVQNRVIISQASRYTVLYARVI